MRHSVHRVKIMVGKVPEFSTIILTLCTECLIGNYVSRVQKLSLPNLNLNVLASSSRDAYHTIVLTTVPTVQSMVVKYWHCAVIDSATVNTVPLLTVLFRCGIIGSSSSERITGSLCNLTMLTVHAVWQAIVSIITFQGNSFVTYFLVTHASIKCIICLIIYLLLCYHVMWICGEKQLCDSSTCVILSIKALPKAMMLHIPLDVKI